MIETQQTLKADRNEYKSLKGAEYIDIRFSVTNSEGVELKANTVVSKFTDFDKIYDRFIKIFK